MIPLRLRHRGLKPTVGPPDGFPDRRIGHHAIPGPEIGGRGPGEGVDPIAVDPKWVRSEAARSDRDDSAESPKETPRTSFTTADRLSHRHRFRRFAVCAPGWAKGPSNCMLHRDGLPDD